MLFERQQLLLLAEDSDPVINASQRSRTHLQPVAPAGVRPRKQRSPRRHPYKLMVVEVTANLAVSVVFSGVAIATLVQLLPYHQSQQAKLQEIKAEVQRTDKRVTRLNGEFTRYFDPMQGKSIMQQESQWVEPNQQQPVWLEESAGSGE